MSIVQRLEGVIEDVNLGEVAQGNTQAIGHVAFAAYAYHDFVMVA